MEELALLVRRLEVVTERLEAKQEGGVEGGSGGQAGQQLSLAVTAFDDICNGTFAAFIGTILRQQKYYP